MRAIDYNGHVPDEPYRCMFCRVDNHCDGEETCLCECGSERIAS